MIKVKIFADGSSKGNPGPGGYGTIIRIEGDVTPKPISDDAEDMTIDEVFESLSDLGELKMNCEMDETGKNVVKIETINSEGYENTTNNRMELMGVIRGFKELQKILNEYTSQVSSVEVISDSKYVSEPFNKGWIKSWVAAGWKNSGGDVKNQDLWKELLSAMEPYIVTFKWVKGHVAHPENNRCDILAVNAASRPSYKLLKDTGYEEG